jgi:protein-S-isoprenylcysteine O-methyltransferase Ste14
MNTYLRYMLPLYFIIYFLFLIVIRAWKVQKTIGKNPVVLSKADDAHGLISAYFLIWISILGIYTIIFSFFPSGYKYFFPMEYLESGALKLTGLVLLLISLLWTYIAQADMHGSWRIGIDESVKTNLVTQGIFRFSRNPIYLGMLASVFGLVLVTPNALTVMLLIVGFVLVQIQVRLEEDFLFKMHGNSYSHYKQKVARFI